MDACYSEISLLLWNLSFQDIEITLEFLLPRARSWLSIFKAGTTEKFSKGDVFVLKNGKMCSSKQ